MKRMYFLIAIFWCLNTIWAQTGREIVEQADAQPQPVSSRALVLMELITSDGSVQTRQVEQVTHDDGDIKNSLILFWSPANVKNTRYLSVEKTGGNKDRWIFLPALNKVRRIASGDGGGSFMGTDFSYDDLSGIEIDDYSYELIKEETVSGYECWVIQENPKPATDTQYSKRISWIDKSTYLTVKAEMYDKAGTLEKTMTAESTAQVQGYWTRTKLRMVNNRTNHATVLEMKKLLYDTDLDTRVFTTNFLKTGRAQ